MNPCASKELLKSQSIGDCSISDIPSSLRDKMEIGQDFDFFSNGGKNSQLSAELSNYSAIPGISGACFTSSETQMLKKPRTSSIDIDNSSKLNSTGEGGIDFFAADPKACYPDTNLDNMFIKDFKSGGRSTSLVFGEEAIK